LSRPDNFRQAVVFFAFVLLVEVSNFQGGKKFAYITELRDPSLCPQAKKQELFDSGGPKYVALHKNLTKCAF